MKNDRHIEAASGFTLVELLIAMLILAIGIMAVLSMQFTALGGAMNSRDRTNAADVARRVINVMRAESQQWRTGTITDLDSVFDPTTSAWNDSASPALEAVADAGGPTSGGWANASWVSLFDAPVDARLSDKGVTRYCAYARGAYLGSNNDIYQVQVAVVFPAANQTYSDNGCEDERFFPALLDPTLTDVNSMEVEGFRVQYFGAQILRRGFLAPGGGVGAVGGA